MLDDNNCYWERVFKRRIEQDPEDPGARFTEIAPWVDMIQPCIRKLSGKAEAGTEGKLGVCAVLPCHRDWWDVVLSLYILHAPEVYQSPRRICGLLLDQVKKVGLKPENFPDFIAQWLAMVHNGERNFYFFDHPLELCYKIKLVTYVEHKYPEDVLHKAPKLDPELYSPEEMEADQLAREKLAVDDEAIRAEVTRKFLNILERHPQLKQQRTDG